MKKFCIIVNREKDENMEVTSTISNLLMQHNCEVKIAKEACNEQHYTEISSIDRDTECAIVIGGDGTILQAAHDLMELNIPILGINLGTLGFLAEIELCDLADAIQKVVAGDYQIEERMMLTATCQNTTCQALNDIVVARSGFSRIICVGVYVNGAWVQDYRGDGVIVATPTGSTGYNLSAGGPILTGKGEGIVITPICPHSFNGRSIVVSSQDVVELCIRESKKTQEEEAIATIDGDMAIKLSANDKIIIKRSQVMTKLVHFKQQYFFELLRSKLGNPI